MIDENHLLVCCYRIICGLRVRICAGHLFYEKINYKFQPLTNNIKMKTIPLITLFCFPLSIALAQWTDSGNNLTTMDNVGIGNTNPLHRLDISGNVKISGALLGGWPTSALALRQNTGSTNSYSWIEMWGDHATRQGELVLAGKYIVLRANSTNTSIGDEVVWVRDNGNVGIGTSAPDAKLAVNGDIHAEEVRVDLNVPGPDYVFEANYELPSLSSIQNYIEVHHHLPEIPSAKEMEENGIELSEMNMLLLKKIEELTLYTLEQEKKIEELKEEKLADKSRWELALKALQDTLNTLKKEQEELTAFKSYVLQKLND